jgi:hypothetical protein
LEHRTFDICNLILCHRHHHPRLIFAQAALLDNFLSYAQFFFSADLLTSFSDISGLGLARFISLGVSNSICCPSPWKV